MWNLCRQAWYRAVLKAPQRTFTSDCLQSSPSSQFPLWYSIVQTSGLPLEFFGASHIPTVRSTVEKTHRQALQEVNWRSAVGGPKSVVLRNPDLFNEYYHFSKEFTVFASKSGIDMEGGRISFDKLHGYEMNECIYKAIIQFGKKISEEHPCVFRDLYLANLHDLVTVFRRIFELAPQLVNEEITPDKMSTLIDYSADLGRDFVCTWTKQIKEWVSEPGFKWACDHKRSLPEQLSMRPECDWYKYAKPTFSGLPWTMFWYLRTLPPAPFDPISNSDVVDPYLTAQVYEKIGLMAAAAAGKKLQVSFFGDEEFDCDDWMANDDNWR